MSGIISESFINKWPRLGRAHLRLQNVFLGWAPKLPDSGTIMGSFHATLCIYFTHSCAFIPSEPLGKHIWVLQEQTYRNCGVVLCSRGSCAEDEGPPPPSSPLLPSPPLSPVCLPLLSPRPPSPQPSFFFFFK